MQTRCDNIFYTSWLLTGIPTVFVSAWVITRIYLEDTG